MATLLRRENIRQLIAEDTFYVQLKSASTKEVQYCETEVAWLRSLELPFFIATVNVKKGEIRLYVSHELYRLSAEWTILGDFKILRVILAEGRPVGFDFTGRR